MTKALVQTKPEEKAEPVQGLAQLVGEGHAIVRIENDTLQQIAIARPRPETAAILKDALGELEAVPEFAALAYYSIPYREKKDDDNADVKLVEGPSVKAAHTLVRMYRNTSSGNRIIGEDDNFVYTQGVMIDLETNTRKLVNRRTNKRAWNKRTQSMYVLSPDRLNTVVGADASKAERNAILNLLPPALVIPYVRRAKELAGAFKKNPRDRVAAPGERWQKAIGKFNEFGVKEAELVALLAQLAPGAEIGEQIGTLVGVYNAIKDGQTSVEEVFGRKPAAPSGGETLVDALLNNDKPLTDSAQLFVGGSGGAVAGGSAPVAGPGELFNENGSIEFDGEIADVPDAELERLRILRADITMLVQKLVPEYPNIAKLERAKVVSTLFARAFKIDGLSKIAEVSEERIEAGLVQMRRDITSALAARGGKPI